MSEHYCDVAPAHPHHGPYHDTQYGFPIKSDSDLFGRLVLEINQAGLSWLTILKKREAFVAAFEGFDIGKVAAYGEVERARLLADAGIIRNKLKVDAVIYNAGCLMRIGDSHGGFGAWLDHHHPLELDAWVKLFRASFKFTGPEIVREFLVSSGYLPGAHRESCPIFARIAKLEPPWLRAP